jgi:hypothetical protein
LDPKIHKNGIMQIGSYFLEIYCASNTTTNRLVLSGETVAVFYKNRTKHSIRIRFVDQMEYFNVKAGATCSNYGALSSRCQQCQIVLN